MRNFKLLQLFANAHTNTSESEFLTPTQKKFYVKRLLENARTKHYFAKYGQKQPLPKGNGKTVEWRQWQTFAPDTTPLVEGVTPDGQTLKMDKKEGTVKQYGNYVEITDVLDNTAYDNVIIGASEELGAQGGETQDILVRNELLTGTNVLYAGGKVSKETLTKTDIVTPQLVNKAATILKKNKAPMFDGKYYIWFIHPSQSFDLRDCEGWVGVHKYSATTEIFNGEIGMLHGCRFIETVNVKVENAAGVDTSVYSSMVFGKDAYGVVEPEGAGWELIVKPAGSGGTTDPLNQRSTVGYKFSTTTKILHPERLLKVETGSSFGTDDETN